MKHGRLGSGIEIGEKQGRRKNAQGMIPGNQSNSIMVVKTIASACGSTGMAGGQALDLGAVGLDIDEDALKTMHHLKTGALIKASVMVPCMLAGSDDNTLAHMSSYGECIGLAQTLGQGGPGFQNPASTAYQPHCSPCRSLHTRVVTSKTKRPPALSARRTLVSSWLRCAGARGQ